MKRRILALTAALVLAVTACNGAAEENTPPAESAPTEETGAPEPSVSSVQPSAAPVEEGYSGVYTDWSRLEPYETDLGQYTRYYEDYTDRLIPVEGGYGGPLIPFAGKAVGIGFGVWDQYYYGLAMADGTVVCDPVYESAYHPSSYDSEQGRYVEDSNFILLAHTFFEGEYDPVYYWLGEYLYTVAAGDGSWVLEEQYDRCFALSDGRLLLLDREGNFWFCDRDGTLERSPLNLKPSQLWGDWDEELVSFGNDMVRVEVYDRDSWSYSGCRLVNLLTGEVVELPNIDFCAGWRYSSDSQWTTAREQETQLWGYLDKHGNWTIPPQFTECDEFEADYAFVTLAGGEKAVIDRNGQVMIQSEGTRLLRFESGGIPFYVDLMGHTVLMVYDGNCVPVPDHPVLGLYLRSSPFDGTAATFDGKVWTFWDVSGVIYTVETDAEFWPWDGLPLFHGKDSSVGLYDPEAGTWVIPMERGYYGISLCYGLEETVYRAQDRANEYDLLNANGELIAHVDEVLGGSGGIIEARDGEYSVFLDLNGEELFRWPIQLNND